ncbi:hypothetical protein CFC21_040881, partial [Triticum aestivum]
TASSAAALFSSATTSSCT